MNNTILLFGLFKLFVMNQKPQSYKLIGKIISFNPPVIQPVRVVTLYELRTYGKYWLRNQIINELWNEAEFGSN